MGRVRATLLAGCAAWTSAAAGPRIRVDAVVSDDLRVIEGTFTVDHYDGQVVPPLRYMPGPIDDLTLLRTFPEAPDAGSGVVERLGPGRWWFRTELPRRFGDVGRTRRGLVANGWWTPQLGDDTGIPVAEWSVRVTVPEGTVGVVGGAWGTGSVTWTGTAERASLAVIRRPVVTPIADGVALVTRGRPRKRLIHELEALLDAGDPPEAGWRGVVVEAPLRRRLARSGPGVAYVSDRAFRVTPPLHRYHRVAVARGVVEAFTTVDAPFPRSVAAAGWVSRYATELRGPPARRLLRWFAWLPSIDRILFDGVLPFHSDVLEATFPGDPIQDDLVEVFDPHFPGTVVVAQLADAFGTEAALGLADALWHGASVVEAADAAGVPADLVMGWDAPYPEQDYRLRPTQTGLVVTRDAAPDAPTEVIVVRVDGVDEARIVGPGPAVWRYDDEAVGALILDPARHTRQVSRVGDAWPRRWRVTATGGVSTINLSEGWVSAGAALGLRRSGDNRNAGGLSLFTSRDTWLAATTAYTRRFGPELSGLSRAHRVTWSASGAWQNQRFADADDRPLTVSGAMTWAWTNRQAGLFPLRGWRLFASTGGGFVPGTPDTWVSLRGSVVRLVPLHPRLVIALRGTGAGARSEVRGRLLSLGGPSAIRSLAYGAAFGTARAVAAMEVRAVPVRNWSVPLGFGWGTELQLTAGLEAGVLDGEDGPVRALGATLGAAGVAETLGVDPFLAGVTVAFPLWLDGVTAARGAEVYLRWDQEF